MLKDILKLDGARPLRRDEQKNINGSGGGCTGLAEEFCVANNSPSPQGDGTSTCCVNTTRRVCFTNGLTGQCTGSSQGYFWYL